MSENKESWPELKGQKGSDAKEAVMKDRPDVTVHVVPDMSPCTMDFRPDRVRIFVDKDENVVGEPRCG